MATKEVIEQLRAERNQYREAFETAKQEVEEYKKAAETNYEQVVHLATIANDQQAEIERLKEQDAGNQDELWEDVIQLVGKVIYYRKMILDAKDAGFVEDEKRAMAALKRNIFISKNR